MSKQLDRMYSHIDKKNDYFHSNEMIDDLHNLANEEWQLEEIKKVLERYAMGGMSSLECIEEISEILKEPSTINE